VHFPRKELSGGSDMTPINRREWLQLMAASGITLVAVRVDRSALRFKFKEIDGVLVSFNFTQRLEMPQGAFFADYKVKGAKLNQPLSDDMFVIQ
jgi:hypothetical protein